MAKMMKFAVISKDIAGGSLWNKNGKQINNVENEVAL